VDLLDNTLPQNSPTGRENPATRTGLRRAVLGFPKRRGGFEPRDRSPGLYDGPLDSPDSVRGGVECHHERNILAHDGA